jgi:Nucleoside diphosphate kinase
VGVNQLNLFTMPYVHIYLSGPIIVMILQNENAVKANRELMGATNPKEAQEGTIRKKYGISIDKNSVHGSDSLENAKKEIEFFFKN